MRAWPLACLLALSALAVPPSGIDRSWMLEWRWILPVLLTGAVAAWALRAGDRRFLPDTAVARAAWGMAAAQALASFGAGMTESGAFRTAQWASLALVASWASRLDAPAVRRVLGTLAALGAVTAALVILQRAGRDPLGLKAGCHGPGAATFFHKGLAAAFLAMALPAAGMLSWGGQGGPWRLAFALVVVGLVWCDTRSAWLGAVAGMAVLCILAIRILPRKPLFMLLGILGAALLLGIFGLSRTRTEAGSLIDNLGQRVRGIVSGPDSNRSLRVAFWGSCVEAWRERPWLGCGPGEFTGSAQRAARALPPVSWDGVSTHAHNDLLETGVESGILGALALLVLAAAAAHAVLKGAGDPGIRAASGGVLAAGAVNAMLVFPLSDAGCATALAACAGFAAGRAPGAAGPRRPALAALALLATFLSLRLPAAVALATSGRASAAIALAPGLEPPRHLAAEQAGDPALAELRLREALRFHPGSSKVWWGLGQVRLLGMDLPAARVLLERAIALAPWNANARIHHAVVRHYEGDPAGAYAELSQCLELLPDFGPLIHWTWGKLLVLEGKDPLSAIGHIEAFLKHRPPEASWREAEAFLARARSQLGLTREPGSGSIAP